MSTKSIKSNVLYNIIGTLYSSIVAFLFVPVYIKNLGAEAYGLIAVFASIQAILALLDGGLSTTLNREFARLNVRDDSEQQLKNTLKSIEFIYFLISCLITIIALGITPYLSVSWVHSKILSLDLIRNSFYVLSISLLFQFPLGLYSGGLIGLQKIKLINILRIFFATFKNFGALILILYFSSNILYFFLWVLFVSIVQIFTYRILLSRLITKTNKAAKFDFSIVINLKKFTLGLTAITLTSILFSQSDKIILSKVLPLGEFGYYSIASTIGLLIFQIIGPITQTYFPKYSELVAKNQNVELKHFFHQGAQLMTFFITPASLFVVLFSKELVWIWTSDQQIVDYTWKLVSIFALGSAFNGLSNIHYQLFLANGWVKAPLFQNILFLILIAPLLLFFTKTYGSIGGAYTWLILNFSTFIFSPLIFHKRYLIGEYFNWLFYDILKPSIFILVIILTIKTYLLPILQLKDKFSWIIFFCFSGIFVLIASIPFFSKLNIRLRFAAK